MREALAKAGRLAEDGLSRRSKALVSEPNGRVWLGNYGASPKPTEMCRLVSIQDDGTGSGKLYQTSSNRLRLPSAK